jgi:hypothetical protein
MAHAIEDDDGRTVELSDDQEALIVHLYDTFVGNHNEGVPAKVMARLAKDGLIEAYDDVREYTVGNDVGGMIGKSTFTSTKRYYVINLGRTDSADPNERAGCRDGEDPCPERRILMVPQRREIERTDASWLDRWTGRAVRYEDVYVYGSAVYTTNVVARPQNLVRHFEERGRIDEAMTQVAVMEFALYCLPFGKAADAATDATVDYELLDAISDVAFVGGVAGQAMRSIKLVGKTRFWTHARRAIRSAGTPLERTAGVVEIGAGTWEAGQIVYQAYEEGSAAKAVYGVASGLVFQGVTGISFVKLSRTPAGTISRPIQTRDFQHGIPVMHNEFKVTGHINDGNFGGVYIVEDELGTEYVFKPFPSEEPGSAAKAQELLDNIGNVRVATEALQQGPIAPVGYVEEFDFVTLDLPDGVPAPEGIFSGFVLPLYPVTDKDCFNGVARLANIMQDPQGLTSRYWTHEAFAEYKHQLDRVTGTRGFDADGNEFISLRSHPDNHFNNMGLTVDTRRERVILPNGTLEEVDIVVGTEITAWDFFDDLDGPQHWQDEVLLERIRYKDDHLDAMEHDLSFVLPDGRVSP